MARLTWSPDARSDLREIRRYIARDSPSHADAMVARIRTAARRLTEFPEMGRAVPELPGQDVREVIVAPYRVLYRYQRARDVVQVVTVLHGSRLLRPLLPEEPP